jgi:hypothetical protein
MDDDWSASTLPARPGVLGGLGVPEHSFASLVKTERAIEIYRLKTADGDR